MELRLPPAWRITMDTALSRTRQAPGRKHSERTHCGSKGPRSRNYSPGRSETPSKSQHAHAPHALNQAKENRVSAPLLLAERRWRSIRLLERFAIAYTHLKSDLFRFVRNQLNRHRQPTSLETSALPLQIPRQDLCSTGDDFTHEIPRQIAFG